MDAAPIQRRSKNAGRPCQRAKEQRTGIPVRCSCMLVFSNKSDAAGCQQLVFTVPELERQIDKISLRVLKALDLLPQRIQLGQAVAADLFDIRAFVYTLARLKQLHTQRAHGIV